MIFLGNAKVEYLIYLDLINWLKVNKIGIKITKIA